VPEVAEFTSLLMPAKTSRGGVYPYLADSISAGLYLPYKRFGVVSKVYCAEVSVTARLLGNPVV
jgi:hypothetical protein